MKFEDMDVWKESARLSVSVYRELAGLKDFGFGEPLINVILSALYCHPERSRRILSSVACYSAVVQDPSTALRMTK